MNNIDKQLGEKTAGASSIYLLLAGIFKDVASKNFLETLKTPQMLGGLEELGCSFEQDFLESPVDDNFIEEMAHDFTQLFIGPSDFISPFESMFHERLDGDWGKLWGADTAKVKKFIESAGVDFANDYGGIPDHISVELEFVGRVTEKIEGAIATEKWRDALYFLKMKKLFLDDHLCQWMPAFCEKITSKAKSSFYREISLLLLSFTEEELKAVDEDIQSLVNKSQ